MHVYMMRHDLCNGQSEGFDVRLAGEHLADRLIGIQLCTGNLVTVITLST